jgi:zinc protease
MRNRFFVALGLAAALTIGATAQTTQQAPLRQSSGQARQAAINLQDTMPFDAAVRTGTLPNGLKFYIRQNPKPAARISLRLAVKAGSINEADDQLGLAHLIEHMAFNGSAHFKPGELVSYFETVGARLGPHVNAYTSFDETVYMLDLPTDKPEIVTKGLTALADFAGGLTLSAEEIDKERGVVIEEWRGGLGAGSRIRDKQLPIVFYKSRYADRLPIGKPEVLRAAPAARLRAFYDTWYRPDRIRGHRRWRHAAGDARAGHQDGVHRDHSARAGGPGSRSDGAAARAAARQRRRRPRGHAIEVSILRKRARETESHVADYRRSLLERFVDHMIDERFSELARKPDAKFLGAGASNSAMSKSVATFSMDAAVEDGKLEDGVGVLATEAKRLREFGFTAAEMDRAKKWMMAFYERAYAEREKTESGSYASEYVDNFLEEEPSPGIAYEYRLVQQLLPGMTVNEASALVKSLLVDSSRVILATSPQKPNIRIPADTDLQAALTAANARPVEAWTETAVAASLMETPPSPGTIGERRSLDRIGVTIVKFGNGVEAWLKPTDFKNDQIIFSLNAIGGASLAPPADFVEASLATGYVGLSGVGGLKALDLEKVLAGKIASARPFVSLATHGISGSAAPAQFETALQLLYQTFMQPATTRRRSR